MAKYVLGKQQIVNDLHLLNSSPLADLLNLCLKSKSPSKQTQRIHARIIKSRFCSETFILNRLIDVYGKSDFVDDAYKVFDQMLERNIFSWNAVLSTLTNAGLLDEANHIFESMPVTDQCSWNSMVSGFAQRDRFDESVEFFVRMHAQDFVLNQYSYGSALSSCAGSRNMKMGTQIHASLSKSPRIVEARWIFDTMPIKNIITETSIISGYAKSANVETASSIRQRQKKEIYMVLKTLTKVMKLFGYVPNVRDLEANEEGGLDLNSSEDLEVPITTEVA
ncbi:hypothetical protein L6452_36802 [Arctium lappa]|uniref:Uncharacterized protein n=1 Tax=Arctium lappa TaxID=4217 RepID=A0ACB8Y187_ARCLA|nr:hypothetical protein L6452_36802 [Arctium lappa]